MRLLPVAAALAATALSTAALAAPKKAAPAAPAGAAGGNAVVATVNGEAIRLSDVAQAASQIPPEQQQQVGRDQLFQKVVEQLINRKALEAAAKREGLDKKPAVQAQMQAAVEQVLVNAELQSYVLPKLNEEAIKAAYDKEYAGKPGEQEVHARHILTDSEAKAKDVVAQLDKGAKFEDLVKKFGDPKAPETQNGGDLGFFKKGDMLTEFSDAAFKLKPNEYTKAPVHTRYGWHVIQLLETRVSQPPTYDQAHDQIRQELVQQNLQAAVKAARDAVKVTVVMQNAPAAPAAPAPAAAPAKP